MSHKFESSAQTMGTQVSRRNTCRLCEASELELVLKLTPTPIVDAYFSEKRTQEIYPLDVFLCRHCGHVQLLDVINPEILFGNYTYVTSGSPGLVEHFRHYADDILRFASAPSNSLVVEIGSNDGTLLKFFKEQGMNVLGIDPARKIAEKANEAGLTTLPNFFTSDLAQKVRREHGPATLVCANNAFAHSDNLSDIVDGVRHLLAQDGIFVFEASYLLDTIEKMVFDFICNEHLSYHSVKPLDKFLKKHGLELIEVIPIATHGGSIRGLAQPLGGPRSASPTIGKMIDLETKLGLDRPGVFKEYANKIESVKNQFLSTMSKLTAQGKMIAGYGASATSTVLIYHFNLGNILSFLVDDNSSKLNLFSPGYHIPVLSSNALYERKPDYVVVLAWRFAEMIREKHNRYLKKGGHFIIPLPTVQFV